MSDVAEIEVREAVRGQDRDELLHAPQQRGVVHAGARGLADHVAVVGADQVDRDLLDRGDRGAVADHHAQVELLDRIRGTPLVGDLGVVVADLDHARRAAEREHVDVVARLVVAAGLHERGGGELECELLGEAGEILGRQAGGLAVVDLAPGLRRVQVGQRLFHGAHHLALVVVAAFLALAVRAAAHGERLRLSRFRPSTTGDRTARHRCRAGRILSAAKPL